MVDAALVLIIVSAFWATLGLCIAGAADLALMAALAVMNTIEAVGVVGTSAWSRGTSVPARDTHGPVDQPIDREVGAVGWSSRAGPSIPRAGISSPARSWAEVILADLVEELATTDPEALGGPGAVAAAGKECSLDRPSFHLGQEGSQRQALGRISGGRHCRVEWLLGIEVFGQDGSAPRGDHRPGEGVRQLPDVPRPGPLPDGRQGVR